MKTYRQREKQGTKVTDSGKGPDETKIKRKNRGFCFLEYEDHKSAAQARRRLMSGKVKVWNTLVTVEWADPIEDPDPEIMAKVKVLFVRNLANSVTEDILEKAFGQFGGLERCDVAPPLYRYDDYYYYAPPHAPPPPARGRGRGGARGGYSYPPDYYSYEDYYDYYGYDYHGYRGGYEEPYYGYDDFQGRSQRGPRGGPRGASYQSDPVEVYREIHTHGVGRQMAALYVSWAQQCERRNLNTDAELIYQKAFSNRAEPLDTLQHHYSMDPQVIMKPKPAALRALVEIPVSTANVTPQGAESVTDESTLWGSGHAPMASFPNHTQDLALSAHLVSTPLQPVTPPILEQSPPEEKQGGGVECTPNAQGTIMAECSSLQRPTHSLIQHSHTHTSITRQALAPLHVLAPLTFSDQSFRNRPSWNIYQSPNQELKSSGVGGGAGFNSSSLQGNSNNQLNSKNTEFLRDCMSEQINSNKELHTSDQVHSRSLTSLSNREFSSHTQNPVTDSPPEPLNSNHQPSTRLSDQKLKIFQEIESDHINSNHSQQTDVEEADLLLPERSFNMHRSVGSLSENIQMQQWKSFLVPQSPDLVARASQDLPMSPEPALGFSWLQVESPLHTAEPDLDLMESPLQTHTPSWSVCSDPHTTSLLEASGTLLSKRSLDRRKSARTLLLPSGTVEGWGCVSPGRDSNPVQHVPMCPAAKPGLIWNSCEDVLMTSPQPNNKTRTTGKDPEISQKLSCDDDVPMSPTQLHAPPTASGFQCTEMLSGRPWTYQDWISIESIRVYEDQYMDRNMDQYLEESSEALLLVNSTHSNMSSREAEFSIAVATKRLAVVSIGFADVFDSCGERRCHHRHFDNQKAPPSRQLPYLLACSD
ncbi:Heterogeneous nuclear ribonucleoprotein Q [Bagarius yarrelli]|uniref:Heterogeneous nuclear ribonucleoprotein Q n=1 Tax=Bagarius yarrelli TaxID=175774 RepID=A0A556VWN2_BAGYA|nr:Heterogeneous nuclear ribonucleoprotein Q [Bagarius yarrelli]